MSEIVAFFKTIGAIKDVIDFFIRQWIEYDIRSIKDDADQALDEKATILLAMQDAKEKKDAIQVRNLARLYSRQ